MIRLATPWHQSFLNSSGSVDSGSNETGSGRFFHYLASCTDTTCPISHQYFLIVVYCVTVQEASWKLWNTLYYRAYVYSTWFYMLWLLCYWIHCCWPCYLTDVRMYWVCKFCNVCWPAYGWPVLEVNLQLLCNMLVCIQCVLECCPIHGVAHVCLPQPQVFAWVRAF